MQVGLLTLHRCINYGSYWQARCLLEGLQALGHDARLLDHRTPRIERAEYRCALNPLLPLPSPAADRPAYARKLRRFAEAADALPRTAPFSLDGPCAIEDFDAVVVGSDEMWNFHHPWYAACRLFFGEGIRAGRLVAHACTFGNYPAARGLQPEWVRRLLRFDSISARDHNTQDLLEQATGRPSPLVLDPCLQFAPALPETPAADPHTAALYGHSFSPWFRQAARAWAGRRSVRLVSIGYRNDWADEQWLDAGPDDFAGFIGETGFLLTNFFHGCVFALRHGKPFACEDSPYRSIKLRSLLLHLGCSERLVLESAGPDAIARVLDTPLPASLRRRLAECRAASHASLADALQVDRAVA
ncbi:polysaccharide pyruvyl transferase family protein [Ramlibacter tataouinensis]|uniref:polysaccharide pyruvyl transferase family protein n=1 Tax=Ramlibacter tataouinensis TaxID=94132 RepID=UPI0022F39C37|nr:polysaccharide pyruvyl transferase family protein [Ramlibacter tataouinensis]WBY02066.1 polysaccharide pyruvyl transferase family protein [Ramlibacter tataouinensis]